MKKIILLFLNSIAFISLNAQISVSSNNNVGIGLSSSASAKNKLDVNGNIQISNSTLPMGIITEVGGTTPLLNFDVNFRAAGYSSSYIGAAFRIDTRPTSQLFQWLYVPVGCSSTSCNRIIMQLNPSSYSGGATLNVFGVVQSNSVTLTSDKRFKKNIKNLDGNSFSKLLQLQAVKYNFQSDTLLSKSQMLDTAFNNRQHIGYIAQDVQKIFPELVYSDKDGQLSMDYISLIPILIEYNKSQQSVIDELKSDISDLKAEINTLKKKANKN